MSDRIEKVVPPSIRWPLRWTVPIALLLFMTIATAGGMQMARIHIVRAVEEEAFTELKWNATRRKASVERAIRANDVEAIQEEITRLGSRRDVMLALLCDENDKVLASMHLADREKPMRQVFSDTSLPISSIDPQELATVRQKQAGKIDLVNGRRTAVAIYDIALGTNPDEMHPTRTGILIIVQDISERKTRALRAVTLQALWFFSWLTLFTVGLGIFFHFGVSARLQRIARAAHELGDRTQFIHTNVGGSDEITELAASIDRVAERLAERQARLEAVLNSAIDAIIVIDECGLIQSANPSTERLFGYPIDELIGQNIKLLMPFPHASEHDQYIARYLKTKERRIIGIGREVEGRRKDGSIFPVDLAVSEFQVGDRKYFSGTIRDISARKAVEVELQLRTRAVESASEELIRMNESLEERVLERTRQLEEIQEQLVRREKLATLGQLAGGVAHEIRNPLGVIGNAVYYLREVPFGGDADVRESLDEISRGLANADRIISELLDYARGSQTSLNQFAIDEAVTAALRIVRIPESIRVERTKGLNLMVRADQEHIERLLANLIQNAVQAMPDGGILSLECFKLDKEAMVKVSDTGVGIAPENLEKIFEPLFTTRARGIGLGLSLCRKYAELSRGQLTVTSEVNKGSTFLLKLPLE